MSENQNPNRFEFTQESVISLVMHMATREDIAAVRSEVKEEITTLRNEMKEDIAKLDHKIDTSLSEFKRSMEATEARMDRKFFAVISITLASTIAIVGLMGHWLHAF